MIIAAIEQPQIASSLAEALSPKEQSRFSWRSDNPSGAVRNAIRHLEKEFTLNEVAAWLKREQYEIQRQDVSFVLSRLAKKGELTVVRKGAGKSPAIFAPLPVEDRATPATPIEPTSEKQPE